MKILIACEFSGIVRREFAKYNHDVISCDLLPTEIQGNHYQGDVTDIINNGWARQLKALNPEKEYSDKQKRIYFKAIKETNKSLEINDRMMTKRENREYELGWELFKIHFQSLWD